MNIHAPNIQVIDFFCGCGGTSAGLRSAGMKIVAGIDNDPVALKTYSTNFPEAKAIGTDVRKITAQALKELLKGKDGPLLIAACAPCQPFSSQNRLKSSEDKRISLLDELHRFVRVIKPDYILLENVPGLQKVEEGPFTRFTNLLDKLGYKYDVDVKDAKKYGVPQTRRRLVLMASRHGEIKLPNPTHGAKDLPPYQSVWEAIGHFPPLEAGGKNESIHNHTCAKISELNLNRLSYTPEGGDRRSWPKQLLLECHKNEKGFTDTYGRLSKNKPSVTLTTKCTSISNGRFGHPDQLRAISVREAAALQTFGDDFIFEGTLGQAAKQVGNAVPVVFAKALGQTINNHYEQVTKQR